MAACALLLATFAATAENRAAASAPKPLPRTSTAALDTYSQEIGAAAQADPGFTGMLVDAQDNRIDLYAKNPEAPRLVSLAARSRVRVVIHKTAHSLSDLLKRTAVAGPRIDALKRQGVDVVHYGPHFQTGEFEVGVRNYSQSTVRQVRAALGTELLVTDASAEQISHTAGRSDDTLPFYGGDFTTNNNGEDCTTAFSMHSSVNNYDYNMSAGHCFRGGDTLVVGSDGYAGAPIGNHLVMGPVLSSYFGSSADNYIDVSFAKLLQTTNYGIVWHDASYFNVKATRRASPGQSVCVDGAYSDQQCNGLVDTKNWMQCLYYNGNVKVCSLIQVYSNNGYAIAGQGDSGAPVYQSSYYPPPGGLGPAYPVGMLNGGNTTYTCPHYPGRTCYKIIQFTDLESIDSQFHVYAKTS